MLGADTSVLVRFLTRDDPKQSPQSRELIAGRANQPIHVSLVALVELVWVLVKVKRRPRTAVLETCRDLLASATFRFEEPELVARAIENAMGADCDLADALIALLNQRAGCEATATFDTKALGLTQMVAVEDRL
ncbi:MAG: type II toxin-antitoxin system VapC family toxin [Devosia sp.]|nr:type II toxin-antitoxin system VapC family toxin [Devosia sp.]